tara:strand:- start:5778 stop:6308 length:531 start_codon:yes stop_codon:yes gene_type:complete
MNIIKIFSLFFLVIFFTSDAYAHGPSRQKVSEKIEIDASSSKVWLIVKDFKNFEWNPNIQETKSKSNEIGAERELHFSEGEIVKQKLEKVNEEKKFVSWRIIETNNKILPVNSYSAKIFVKESESGKTSVNYKAGFYRGFMGNDPPEELNDENSKKKVKSFIIKSLEGLKKIAETN